MKRLNEDIKQGKFKNIYLLYGEEDYLKKQYRDRLKQAMLPDGDTVNYAHFEGKGLPVGEVIDLAETMPFFAERRLIVIEDSGLFKSSAAELADYVKGMPETTVLLFVENEIDKRNKLYKAVKDKGCVVEMARQEEKTLTIWLMSLIRQEGKKIRESTIRHILDRCGTDMKNLETEMEKLFTYTIDREEITDADVDAVCTAQIEGHIFEMIDAAAMGDKKQALEYYYDLLALKEPPMRILYLLTKQFRSLLVVQSLMRRGMAQKQVATEAGLHPFVAGKCMRQCRSFSEDQLRKILEMAAELELDVKTGRLKDVTSVELFILSPETGGQAKR